jgi:hypothetical protein
MYLEQPVPCFEQIKVSQFINVVIRTGSKNSYVWITPRCALGLGMWIVNFNQNTLNFVVLKDHIQRVVGSDEVNGSHNIASHNIDCDGCRDDRIRHVQSRIEDEVTVV